MKKLNLIAAALALLTGSYASAQTDPTPFALSSGDYVFSGFTDEESTEYPASTQGWHFGSEPGSDMTGSAAGDRDLAAQSSSFTSGSIRNEGAAGISFLNSGSNHIGALALALNSEGAGAVTASFTVEDIRDGSTRQNGIVLQYRVGNDGDFTTVEETLYLSNPEGLGDEAVFTDIPLPGETANQPLVQLRWLYFYEAGSGARDRIRLDDITVTTAELDPVDVTFRVDMSEFGGTIDASGMHLAGNFPEDTWNPGARPMTDEGDGVWTYTEEGLEPGFALEYKFVLGNDWPFGDENMGGQPCSAPGTTNRSLSVPAENTTLPLVCYNSCNPCGFVAETVSVTFSVDMSLTDLAPEGAGISGSFNDFAFEAMEDQGDGIYTFTTDLEVGSTIEYKFRNGDEFESPPAECSSGPFNNRELTVTEETVLEPVCYGTCAPCAMPGEMFEITFAVDASQIEVAPEGLFIAGTFNGFSPEPMTDAGDGIYSFTAEAESGTTVLWKYLNGDNFDNAETVPEACGEDDGFGGFNRAFEMPEADTVLDLVCFGACGPCEVIEPGDPVDVTFAVDASLITTDPAGMHISGSFNDFIPEAMEEQGDGIWTFTAAIASGTEATWKFINGDTPAGEEGVPAECGEDDGFGGFNRSLLVPAEDTVLDPVCFASCGPCETEPGGNVNVTFFVDMSLEDIDPLGVGISGSFNGFAFQEMIDQGAGLYSFTAELESGVTYEYKFRNGDEFENPPAACGLGDFNNRVVTVGETDMVLDIDCYSACGPCDDPVEQVTLTLQVDASQIEIDATGMHIAGNFNGFTPEPMQFGGNDIYVFEAQVDPGSVVLWKFLNGDNFDGAETVPVECGEPDGFGGFNREFTMPAADFVFDPVCFGSCTACVSAPEDVSVTFNVDASSLVAISQEGIHIAGNFNGFAPEPMADAGDNVYTLTVNVEPGTTLLWKYLNGDDFELAETVPEECGEDDGFGGFNRVFNVPAIDQVLDLVCFNLCGPCEDVSVFNTEAPESFQVFPNPNNGEFSLVAPKNGVVDLRIYDLSGRLVHANRFLTVEGDVVNYNRAMLENGYYVAQLRYEDGIYSSKIMVKR